MKKQMQKWVDRLKKAPKQVQDAIGFPETKKRNARENQWNI